MQAPTRPGNQNPTSSQQGQNNQQDHRQRSFEFQRTIALDRLHRRRQRKVQSMSTADDPHRPSSRPSASVPGELTSTALHVGPAASNRRRSPNPRPQNLLFVDSNEAATGKKTDRQDARRFLMRNLRRERPWSTSKRSANRSNSRNGSGNSPGPSKNTPGPSRRASESNAGRKSPSPVEFSILESNISAATTTGSPQRPTIAAFSCIEDTEATSRETGECGWCLLARQNGQPYCQSCLMMRTLPDRQADNPGIGGAVDPFESYSIQLSPKASQLLQHWNDVLTVGGIPLDIHHRTELFKTSNMDLARGNKAAMHALLCSAALHSAMLGQSSTFDVMTYKSNAVTEVNKNLSHPVRGLEDGNICAVFYLLCIEETMLLKDVQARLGKSANTNSRIVHLNGLKRMIDLRGGIGNLSTNPCLQGYILWHATAHAITSLRSPHIDITPLENNISWDSKAEPDTALSESLRRSFNVHESLLRLVSRIQTFLPSLSSWFDNTDPRIDVIDLQNRGCLLQLQLLRWLTNDLPDRGRTPVENCFCLALLVFTNITTESNDCSFKLLNLTILKRMKYEYQHVDPFDWAAMPALHLWVLVIGAVTAIEEPFFHERLQEAFHAYSISSFEELKQQLTQIFWLDCRLAAIVTHVWSRQGESEHPLLGLADEGGLDEVLPDAPSRHMRDAAIVATTMSTLHEMQHCQRPGSGELGIPSLEQDADVAGPNPA